MAAVQMQYVDVRDEAYSTGFSTLARRLVVIQRDQKPRDILITNAFDSWYDHSQGRHGFGFGVATYVAIQLDEPPSNKPRGERHGDERAVVIDPDQFGNLQALLDELYAGYLRDAYPPSTYGLNWILEERSRGNVRGIHPARVVVPWKWLTMDSDTPISAAEPYWGRLPLEHYGIQAGGAWIVTEPTRVNRFGKTPRDDAFGIAVNSDELLLEIFEGFGKQPHPPYQAGFLERVPYEDIEPSAFRHLVVALDAWTDSPFAGQALRETKKMFDRRLLSLS
jgi:hypothetical protein